MNFQIRKVQTKTLRERTPELYDGLDDGIRYAVTKYKTISAGFVQPVDLKVLSYLSKLRPELVSRLFENADHEERLPLAAIVSWLEDENTD